MWNFFLLDLRRNKFSVFREGFWGREIFLGLVFKVVFCFKVFFEGGGKVTV